MEVVNGKFNPPKNIDASTLFNHEPWCMCLFLCVFFLLYKIFRHKLLNCLPRITKQQLKHYDANNPDGIYLVAIHGVVYNVSTAPRDFGPYGIYGEVTGNDVSDYINGKNFSRFCAGNEKRIWEFRLENEFKPVAELWSESGFWPF